MLKYFIPIFLIVVFFNEASVSADPPSFSKFNSVRQQSENNLKALGAVNDFAGIIPADIKKSMESLSREILKKTGTTVVVATVKSVDGAEPDTYARELFNAWGIGKKGEDKGVLIFVALQERKIRIETGHGMSKILPDGLVGNILDQDVVPYCKSGDYGQGLLSGMLAVGFVIAKDAGVTIGEGYTLKKSAQTNEAPSRSTVKEILMKHYKNKGLPLDELAVKYESSCRPDYSDPDKRFYLLEVPLAHASLAEKQIKILVRQNVINLSNTAAPPKYRKSYLFSPLEDNQNINDLMMTTSHDEFVPLGAKFVDLEIEAVGEPSIASSARLRSEISTTAAILSVVPGIITTLTIHE